MLSVLLDTPQALIARVSDEDTACAVDSDADRSSQAGRGRWSTVPGETRPSVASHSPDRSRRQVDEYYLMALVVAYKQVAVVIERQLNGASQRHLCRGFRFGTWVIVPPACDRDDDAALRVDLADPVVIGVGDVEVPRRINNDTGGRIEEGFRRRTAVSRESCGPVIELDDARDR